jgi:hypothetical protein
VDVAPLELPIAALEHVAADVGVGAAVGGVGARCVQDEVLRQQLVDGQAVGLAVVLEVEHLDRLQQVAEGLEDLQLAALGVDLQDRTARRRGPGPLRGAGSRTGLAP